MRTRSGWLRGLLLQACQFCGGVRTNLSNSCFGCCFSGGYTLLQVGFGLFFYKALGFLFHALIKAILFLA